MRLVLRRLRQRAVVPEHCPNSIERPSPSDQRHRDDPIGKDYRSPEQCNRIERFRHCQAGPQQLAASQDTTQAI
jgi:hypothetical protein